ncbi:hypothetical protein F5Y04DRAFT_4916 [Hypomontagnella monticulosa]|nr:hypothetical protein F5Y04DRAFT_4916 [Hypomontagnella monticulosa]
MERQRRRRRPALSCLECRRRKIKCNRNEPCAHCVSAKLQCNYKVYSDEPVIARPAQRGVPRADISSPSTLIASPLTQPEQTNTSTLVTEPWGPSAEGEADQPSVAETLRILNSLGRNDSQPPNQAQDIAPGIVGVLQQGQKPEKSSAPSPIHGLSESGRDILSRQLGLRDSQIILNKTRILGWSLRIGTAKEFAPVVACYIAAANSSKDPSSQETELGALYAQLWNLSQKCKNLARSIKLARPSRWLSYPEFDLSPPSREVADAMATLYFRSFESTHRILHEPTFWSEYQRYWDHPESVTPSSRLRILLVIGIGSSLSEHADLETAFRGMVQQWIYAAQTWLSGPLEKDRLDVPGIQLFCLTILARQIFSIGGDLVWASVGSLIHTAMQIGLHRDPKHLPKMSVLQAEIRRRLWATVVEMVVQASLDTAMPPRISLDDFDTEAPSNNSDDELDESTTTLRSHSRSTYTTTSIQLTLLDLLPTRLRILQLLNGLHSELSYLDALALSSQLTDQYRACLNSMKENEKSGITAFHRNLLDYLVRRFLIPLHCPFAGEARTNPLFYYSLKVSLDSAMTIISPEPDEGFSRLMAIGGGMFREGLRYAMTVLTRELVVQVEAQRVDGTLRRNSQYVELLKKNVSDMVSLSLERIRQGETNVKGPMFLSMIMAHVEAVEEGVSGELKLAQSARETLDLCYNILRARAGGVSPPCMDNAGFTPRSLDSWLGGYGLDLDFDSDFFLPDAGVV